MPKYEFTLSPSSGAEFNSTEHLPLIVYFYPKGNMPGYATEGLGSNARLEQFRKLGYTAIGISCDGVRSHQNFCTKQGFQFELLGGRDETMCKLFSVIRLKKLYGRESSGVERSIFVLDAKGETMHEWCEVKMGGCAQKILGILGGQWRGRLKM